MPLNLYSVVYSMQTSMKVATSAVPTPIRRFTTHRASHFCCIFCQTEITGKGVWNQDCSSVRLLTPSVLHRTESKIKDVWSGLVGRGIWEKAKTKHTHTRARLTRTIARWSWRFLKNVWKEFCPKGAVYHEIKFLENICDCETGDKAKFIKER